MSDRTETLAGWDRLSHHGLLLDVSRLQDLARLEPEPLSDYTTQQLRLRAGTMMDEAHRGSDASANRTAFVTFVLEQVCGLDAATGTWLRGSAVPSSERRRTATGESVKPNHLWKGIRGARMPVFIDDSKRLGLGRSRRTLSQAIGYLRAGNEHLALLTNGRHWRLLFAGLDYEAWCDWDTDLWFEEGELADQVSALRTLLNANVWKPDEDGASPALLQAIRDTRKGQAELSEVLGERVREAVEILIRGHGDILTSLAITHSDSAAAADIYRAGCRVAMRLVVILFAESRELLPRDNALYHGSYGLNGLFEQLERDGAQGRAMRESYSAWPRVLALFKLVREGSHHPDLPVTKYGGELFAPGESEGDALSEALAVFENASLETTVLPDADVHEILKLLTRTTMRIRQGKSSTRTTVPVDFTDLSSEYIGILYEGLLDYELKTAPTDDPVVFLATGDQPALPLSRLEAMDARALKALFSSFKDSASDSTDEVEEKGETETAATQPGNELPIEEAAEARAEFTVKDERQLSRERAEQWAREAVQATGLVSRRGKNTPERELRLREETGRKARQLVARVVLPGEWYLVRWGGTRKGSGSFYTRPGLTIPTVQRTLRPLAYEPPKRANGKPNPEAPPSEWTPRTPERILELKVCDPACGSGSFPLAALRFLTDAVYAALQHHERIEKARGDRSLVRLLGVANGPHEGLAEEQIPCPPDDDRFEDLTKAVLRRYVVERCIYAVDVDPLAVELCRLSLWIETMDRSLPFSFLDHKIKCGNSLVGAWFDQFQHYPAMAWKNREGGDNNHSNGVHYKKGERTKAIKAFVKDKLKLDLKLFLQGQDLLQEDLLELAASAHADALAVLDGMHRLPIHDAVERARFYRQELVGSEAWQCLKEAMDLWCACWFWPTLELDAAPLPRDFADPSAKTRAVARQVASTMRFFHWELEFPDVFRQAGSGFDALLGNPPWDTRQPDSKEYFSEIDPLYRTYGKQRAIQRQKCYFSDASLEMHWLDYGSLFASESNWMKHAGRPFGDPDTSSRDRFVVSGAHENLRLHHRWREARSSASGFSNLPHPFVHRGQGKAYTYRLFLEIAHALLKLNGRLGFIVPSGLYSDQGSSALRSLFLEHCRWEWLFSIENRDAIFPIHRSYKFNAVIVQKGGETKAINTAFMCRKLEDWERAEDIATPYSRAQVEQFSPHSRAILEIQSARDLEILSKIYANGVLLGDGGPNSWGVRYSQGDFNMTTDSHLFSARPQWEAKGYRPDEYSRWLLGNWRPMDELWEMLGVDSTRPEPSDTELEEWLFDTTAGPERRQAEAQFVHGHWLKPGDVARTDWRLRCAQPPYDRLPVPRMRIPAGIVLSREADAWIQEEHVADTALPLYQGIMVQPFMPSARGWLSGTGLRAKWDHNDPASIEWNPQFLMAQDVANQQLSAQTKIGYREVARSTDERSFIGAILPSFPCGHKVPVLRLAPDIVDDVSTAAALFNSFVFDWLARQRLGGAALAWHVLTECALPLKSLSNFVPYVSKLNFFPSQLSAARILAHTAHTHTAILPAERLRMRVVLDVMASAAYGCTTTDLRHILKDSDISARTTAFRSNQVASLDPRGFWRVDRNINPEHRHTVLTLVAHNELESKTTDEEQALDAFLGQNHGEGWLLPETLRLADHRLGHDDRAKHPQVVSRYLGPRFFDWQLVQSANQSREESHVHARNTLGAGQYSRLLASLDRHTPFDAPGGYKARETVHDEHGPLDRTGLVEAAKDPGRGGVNRGSGGSQSDLFE